MTLAWRFVHAFIDRAYLSSSANTQIDPPSGTAVSVPAGSPRVIVPCIPRASMPKPDTTAMYCFPSTENDVGCPRTPEFVGNSHNTLPLLASKARNFRSFVPPLKTRSPAVASIGPHVAEVAKVWVHTFFPVSTFHA